MSEQLVDGIECVRCARRMRGLYVRLTTGICTYCQPLRPRNPKRDTR